MNRGSQWTTRDVFSMLANRASVIWTGFLRVSIALLAIAGFATLVLLTVIYLEGMGLHSIVEIGAAINETAADSMDTQQYTGHLLSVVIISLSGLALLATFIGIAATLGLTSHARALEREIRDEMISSSHQVFESMARIETAWVQSQASLDIAVYEWASRAVWEHDTDEKNRAVVRGYTAAKRAHDRVNEAQQRLNDEAFAHRHIKAVQEHIGRVRVKLDKLQANIRNSLAFYLVSLIELKLLENPEPIRRGLLPEKAVAEDEALLLIAHAVETVGETQTSARDLKQRCHVEETALYVNDRLGSESEKSLRDRMKKLQSLVNKTHARLPSEADKDKLKRWWSDRRDKYPHLWE